MRPSLRASIFSVLVTSSMAYPPRASRARFHLSQSIRLAQRGDLLRAEAEFLQNSVRVLAEAGWRRHQSARRTRERHGLARHAQRFLVPGLDRLGDTEMHDLRIGIDLIDRVDRPAGNAGLVEQLDPFRAATLDRVALHVGVERVAMLRALGGGLIFRTLRQLLGAGGFAEARPDARSGR